MVPQYRDGCETLSDGELDVQHDQIGAPLGYDAERSGPVVDLGDVGQVQSGAEEDLTEEAAAFRSHVQEDDAERVVTPSSCGATAPVARTWCAGNVEPPGKGRRRTPSQLRFGKGGFVSSHVAVTFGSWNATGVPGNASD